MANETTQTKSVICEKCGRVVKGWVSIFAPTEDLYKGIRTGSFHKVAKRTDTGWLCCSYRRCRFVGCAQKQANDAPLG